MNRLALRALVAAAGLWVAAQLVDGLQFDSGLSLLLAAILLGVINASVRPVAIVLTLPITIVTLGLFLLIVNAAMLGLAALFLPGFHIAGFWDAFWGAVIVSIVSSVGSWLFGPKGGIDLTIRRE